MTEKLTTLLHERADHVDFALPDLEAVVRDGERRVRRRGAARIAGGVAVLAVAAAIAVPQLGGGSGHGRAPVAVDPGAPARVSWVLGSVLHEGDRTTDLGFEVTAYVRTASGIVATGPDGTVHSVVDGEAVSVGRTDARHPHLVADEEGSLAGWVNTTGEGPAFLVLDQSTGEVMSEGVATERGPGGLADDPDPADFYAIDGHTAYWRDARGAVAVTFPAGGVRVVDAGAGSGFDIRAVENGVLAFTLSSGDASADGTALGTSREDAVLLPQVYGSIGTFSPDARYYSADADEPQVYDARSGERVTFDLGYAFATGYEWLDATTLAMIAQDTPRSPVQLITCTVPAGTCAVAVDDLGSFDDLTSQGFSLPVGDRIDD